MLLAPATLLGVVAAATAPAGATFTSTTANSDSFSAGSISLTDNTAGAAMFNVSGLTVGSSGSACIEVQYTGTAPVGVKMYVPASGLSGSLGSYLQFKVEQGSGTAVNCSDFVASSTIYNAGGSSSDTLAAFASSAHDFSTGVGSWTPAANATMSYRISYLVLRNSYASGATASVTFTWEADMS